MPLTSAFTRVLLDAALPLVVTFVVVSFLADPARINTHELGANSLLRRP